MFQLLTIACLSFAHTDEMRIGITLRKLCRRIYEGRMVLHRV